MKMEQGAEVAIVLGRENSGLTNEELEHCQLLVTIPTNPDFSSLNIAAAAQVLCYEIRMAGVQEKIAQAEADSPLATSAEKEGLFEHFEQALTELEFLNPENPGQLMRLIKRLFARTGLERLEVNVLRGILNAAQKAKSGNKA
jgi:TrmH family RNA methyltransferase